jgi:hypothetical protein
MSFSTPLVPIDTRFQKGATHLVVGPSASGKTVRTSRFLQLKNDLFQGGENIQNVIFCYEVWQSEYDELKQKNVVSKWINKLPSNDEFIELVKPFKDKGGSIVVLDDFMSGINTDLMQIVCVSSRHYNTSTFLLFQSLFPSNKLARQISLNVKYLHIHKNPRENNQFRYLARQLLPNNDKWLVEAFHDATTKPHSCFLIDLTQQCSDFLRYRSNILPEEFPLKIYVKKGTAKDITL